MITRRPLLPLFASLALAACGGGSAASTASGTSTSGGNGGGSGGATTTTSGTGGAPADDIRDALAKVPGLTVAELASPSEDYRYFSMTFDQPQDHQDPGGEHFSQRLTLLYRGAGKPVVLASTGYDISPMQPYLVEPTSILDASQILVEHRFFAASRPSPADWTKLTIQQAADDHHAIVAALKPLLPGKWISTGGSKGGMTSVYHRRFHPDDVDGTIAYVAPESYGDADPRYLTFLQQVGDPACRAALTAFQVEVLKRRPAMIQRLTAEMAQNGETFTLLDEDAALDYGVVEFAFTFWQYSGSSYCSKIPAVTASDDALWSFLNEIDAPSFWNDASMLLYEPYYFQAAVQLGYPGYDDSAYASELTVKPGSDVAKTFVFPGPTKAITFQPEAMKDVATWLSTEASAMLFIYGQNDPYTAAAFDPTGAKQSALFTAADGTHGSEIADLSSADQAAAYQLIQAWTGIKPKPARPSPRERAERQRRRPL